MSDVRRITDNLCKTPWVRVAHDIPATMTLHTEEGLDWNAPERDRFDAAEWCAEHSDGMHRAYAQAACYVFELPDSALGRAIENISVLATSDPYNPYGARIAAMVSDTLDIPMDCSSVRTGDVYRAPDDAGMGAAPRLYVDNADGTQTWYANSETVDLVPSGQLLTKKFLFVFCALENYNRGREGWIEGSSYIENDIAITLSDECKDLAQGELNDLSPAIATQTFHIVSKGVLSFAVDGQPIGERHTLVRADANLVVEEDGRQTAEIATSETGIASALSRAYSAFYLGDGDTPTVTGYAPTFGAAFNVTQSIEDIPSETSDSPTPTAVVRIDASALTVPFAWPRAAIPRKILLTFPELRISAGARFNVFLASTTDCLRALTTEQLKSPGLWDGQDSEFALLGSINGGTSAEFTLPTALGRMGTIVITGWMPPESYDFSKGGAQGTGTTGFLPDIAIIM
jgi:hypothetical protein